ncbi:hypothetical protein AJ80_08073 [Polytolypa hystricis UAMH7299]|uniref:CTLH domain-containing protein n=1 Tax=Polytolypa hystricis (strain UAMH7299) TaxID=1447883 RepID=A0A2B7XDS4_POLH7|nr:hypothetical protein AJ80_08073 [Polytolypa hystricis UAMH7299]
MPLKAVEGVLCHDAQGDAQQRHKRGVYGQMNYRFLCSAQDPAACVIRTCMLILCNPPGLLSTRAGFLVFLDYWQGHPTTPSSTATSILHQSLSSQQHIHLQRLHLPFISRPTESFFRTAVSVCSVLIFVTFTHLSRYSSCYQHLHYTDALHRARQRASQPAASQSLISRPNTLPSTISSPSIPSDLGEAFPLPSQLGGPPVKFELADESPSHTSAPAAATLPDPSLANESSDSPNPNPNPNPRSTVYNTRLRERTSTQTSSNIPSSEVTPGAPLEPERETVGGSDTRRTRRRRRREETPELVETASSEERQLGLGQGRAGLVAGQQCPNPRQPIKEDGPPSPKRRRLASNNMRPDGGASTSNANGFSPMSNGSAQSPLRKSTASGSLNGKSPHSSPNGQSQANGSVKSFTASQSYFGHDREEVTRILIQSLNDMGYNAAATSLSRESGYDLESPAVAAFRSSVLDGQWSEAERILLGSFYPDGGGGRKDGGMQGAEDTHPSQREGLVLAETADKNEMLFCLRQQKFLELLEQRDLGSALMVLRQELTPLNHDIGQLHALSSLLMCPPDQLQTQAGWSGSIRESREKLLSELSKSISPAVMIPEHRLAALLDHVKQDQINHCLYHNTATPPSLYSDHLCDPSSFPLHNSLELSEHRDEVWYLEFSHDGTKLATTSRDCKVFVYDVSTFKTLHSLEDHKEPVAYATWSPDDSKLITCSQDNKAKLWDVQSGRCLLTINHHHEPVTSAAWAPDGESFVTGSLDSQSQLCHWGIRGQALYTWPGNYRVRDCAISPDGQRLIAISTEKKIYVYNFVTRDEVYSISLKLDLTCINISHDSRYMLVNMSDSEVQLLDIETADVVRQFAGQKQGNFIIRSTFGGAAENFVVSGSEDSRIYIWHKENSQLVECLDGHVQGCVNAVAWNPRDPGMFASAGDDRKVRIWTKNARPRSRASSKSRMSSKAVVRSGSLRPLPLSRPHSTR